MAERFSGRVALVTGGSNGLGRAIVRSLVAEGANVCILDLAEHAPFAEIEAIATVIGDVAEPGSGERAFAEAVARFGGVDVLINDAAAYPDARIVDMPVDDWRRVFDVNVAGPFALLQAFARHRIARGGGGTVVNITPGSVKSPRPAGSAYAASKAALETLSKVAAMELGPHRIRVNVVAPGYIDVRGESDCFPDRASDELRERLVESIPRGRAGRPDDVANAGLWLCCEDAAHVSGAVIDVDGASLAGRFSLTGEESR
jgi:NAD(P)-dependent dehydrogenase (short-subunit alcohol dehydrogenase family)